MSVLKAESTGITQQVHFYIMYGIQSTGITQKVHELCVVGRHPMGITQILQFHVVDKLQWHHTRSPSVLYYW